MPRSQLQTIIALLVATGKTGGLIVSQKWSCVPWSWREFVDDTTAQTDENSFYAQVSRRLLPNRITRIPPSSGACTGNLVDALPSTIHCSSGCSRTNADGELSSPTSACANWDNCCGGSWMQESIHGSSSRGRSTVRYYHFIRWPLSVRNAVHKTFSSN